MRTCRSIALAAAVVCGLAACGGGGGGGGIPLLPIVTTPPPPAPPPPSIAELKLTVEVGGAAATPDGDGKYSVVPGQQVVVTASDNVAWLGSANGSGVTRTEVDTSPTRWISRFDNPSQTQAGSYKLVATGSNDRTKELNFIVQTGDYRNGEYMVFAASGSPRHKLNINFDTATYSLNDATGVITSGALTPPAGAGDDWFFQSSRIGPTNTSSLKPLSDTIVGAFPFDTPFASPVTYTAAPFVATRAFVLSQARLDGAYNRARISILGSARDSAIAQIEISGGGTVMKQCVDAIIYRIADCPTASVVTSRVEADPAEPGMWTLTNPASGVLLGRFAVAMVDGEKVYLTAGVAPADGSQTFAIGVPEARGYDDFTSSGWSTGGTLETSTVVSPTYTLAFSAPVASSSARTMSSVYGGTTGMRQLSFGTDTFFAMRSPRLDIVIGARSQPATRGVLHLGVIN